MLKGFMFVWSQLLGGLASSTIADVLVPQPVEEAVLLLDEMLPAAEKLAFQSKSECSAIVEKHFSWRGPIRNDWLRSDKPQLLANLKVQHIDDASSIILSAY